MHLVSVRQRARYQPLWNRSRRRPETPAPQAQGGPNLCPDIYAPVICSNGKVYPNQCYADKAHANGMKFILWFEPERVRPKTPLAKEHPEKFSELKKALDAHIARQAKIPHRLPDGTAADVIEEAFAWWGWVEEVFSTFRVDSEISRIGRGELASGKRGPIRPRDADSDRRNSAKPELYSSG